MDITISLCSLPLGGIAGPTNIFPDVLQKVRNSLKNAEGTLLTDSFVTHAGDRLMFMMVHTKGSGSEEIANLKDQVISEAVFLSEKRRLYKREEEQVLLGISFSERESEQFVLFLSTASSKSFWNPMILSAFANPFVTESVLEGNGFIFGTEGCDLFQTPKDLHRLCTAAQKSKISYVSLDEKTPAASASSGVCMISRAEGKFPSVSELCDSIASIKHSEGFFISPVSLCDASFVRKTTASVVALGFSVADGKLTGPVDLFDHPSFEYARIRSGMH